MPHSAKDVFKGDDDFKLVAKFSEVVALSLLLLFSVLLLLLWLLLQLPEERWLLLLFVEGG